jgi:hypothetical protein
MIGGAFALLGGPDGRSSGSVILAGLAGSITAPGSCDTRGVRRFRVVFRTHFADARPRFDRLGFLAARGLGQLVFILAILSHDHENGSAPDSLQFSAILARNDLT